MSKKSLFPFILGSLFTLLIIAVFAFRDNVKDDTSEKQAEEKNTMDVEWRAPAIPQQLSFAGEAAPIDRWDVREKFDKEFLNNYYSQGNVLYLMKLANRNFPIISERLKANGVPDDFKYLCIAESNMQGWATSSAGAAGYWQFMSGTAPGYGLENSSQVDQRRDLVKSTDAACKYFKQAYNRFGNWTAAAASYNCGMGGYGKAARIQKTNNYYDLYLPEETNKYIYRILTFKYLMENADALGFQLDDEEKYQPLSTRRVAVEATISDLSQFAIQNGTSYKVLRTLNPWLKGNSLPVSKGKTYTLELPQ